jgi:hypothetical protein
MDKIDHITHLTRDGVPTLVRRLTMLQPRQVLTETYIFQVVENYFPSKQF